MNKTVLITGASRGIGFALAQQFLNNEYHVIGTSRTGEITNLTHPNFHVIRLDIGDEESIKTLEQILVASNLKIDILINNAAIGTDLDTMLPDRTSFKETFDINVTGTVFFTEMICKFLKIGGKIINISSKMGSIERCERTDSVAYRMSKTALNMYSKILTNRLVGKQTVASVHPGWVKTTIAPDNVVNGRLSPDESASRIFRFVETEFQQGKYSFAMAKMIREIAIKNNYQETRELVFFIFLFFNIF
jgi:NAD(P)-dependent dehydrogenase (short-subunit alcohol dehydrogenase family)